ncbi:MAG TPA: fasciclin domain-containing protein [Pyrinomonadaceae bacterium]|nr:fasciclin domain-containing protein [Pyrinomonadaceae bacterium]
MKKTFLTLMLCMFALAAAGATASAQMMSEGKKNDNPTVGGAAMFKTKTIVENAMESPIHKTLVAAVKAAGLVETLSGKGPFTVFAPTDDAFGKLPAGTVESLVQPENKAMLTRILTYHVVAGRMDSKKLAQAIKKGGGRATLKTVSGGTLTAMMHGDAVMLTDEKGGTAMVTTADVYQSNGVIHVIDTVVMPR